MNEFEKLAAQCEKEEKTLQFKSFSYDEAFKLGTLMYNKAKAKKLPMAFDIIWNGQQVFHAAVEGTKPNNDVWLAKKANSVNMFHISSFHLKNNVLAQGVTFEEKYHLDESEFACCGGGFPLIIKGAGICGSICVSGLPDYKDHEFLIESLKEYLKK